MQTNNELVSGSGRSWTTHRLSTGAFMFTIKRLLAMFAFLIALLVLPVAAQITAGPTTGCGGGGTGCAATAINTIGTTLRVATITVRNYTAGDTYYVFDDPVPSCTIPWTYLTPYIHGSDLIVIGYEAGCTTFASEVYHGYWIFNSQGFLNVKTYSGTLTTSGVFLAGSDSGAVTSGATSLATGSVTPDGTGRLVVSAWGAETSADIVGLAVNSGLGNLQAGCVGAYACGGFADLIDSSSGAINPTWTWTDSQPAEVAVAIFEPAVTARPPSRVRIF